MKRMYIHFLLVVFSLPAFSQGKIDVLHYKYEIELSDNSDLIKGKATITLQFLEPTDIFNLDLTTANKDGKGMQVNSCSEKEKITCKQYSDKLEINLKQTAKAGETKTFTIEYNGIPDDGLIISKNKFGKRTFFADNWPNRAHHWIPCVDNPADKATTEFFVTAPAQYEVVSNGIQMEEKYLPGNTRMTYWKEEVPLPTKVMVIGVADFAIDTIGQINNDVLVSNWVYPENEENGFSDYAQAFDILLFFQDYIGPYPYKKLANVQSTTIFGGMENASAIFYHENSVTGKRKEESLLAHEIAHQWFGDMVTEKSFDHLWLSEGFATYLTHIYLESQYGTDSLNTRMDIDRAQVLEFSSRNQLPVVDSISPYMKLLNANSYQKGSWVLHMLRRELGDTVFQRIIRTYYNKFKGKNADTRDFQAITEEVTGKKMETFFTQWLYSPVFPKLKVEWQYLKEENKLEITTEQLQKAVFAFPLEIKISFPENRTQVETLHISNLKETFSFPAKPGPISVVLDPNTSLLFTGTIVEKKN